MPLTKDIVRWLEDLAPLSLAEEWDNVGLLLGDADREVSKVMTCLTLTEDVVAEAAAQGAELVVAHHPIMFRPVQQITTATSEGRLLHNLMSARISVFSPHTGYDSASAGINRQLAEAFGLDDIGVLRPSSPIIDQQAADSEIGAGRYGDLSSSVVLAEFLERVKDELRIDSLQYVGDPTALVQRVGIACGAAAEFLPDALEAKCHLLLTGEARFHDCLAARTAGIALVLPGHYATERPAMERLAENLAIAFPGLTVWPSRDETDPLRWN
jgi:dinuclear metal center YbgI/SA1388 family protein